MRINRKSNPIDQNFPKHNGFKNSKERLQLYFNLSLIGCHVVTNELLF